MQMIWMVPPSEIFSKFLIRKKTFDFIFTSFSDKKEAYKLYLCSCFFVSWKDIFFKINHSKLVFFLINCNFGVSIHIYFYVGKISMLVLFTEITYRTVEVVQQLDPSSNREILIDIKVYQTTKPTLSNNMLSQTFF